MVKIKTICRSDQDYTRETKQDIYKISKNINPNIHPFIKAREYQRALVATKIDKIFAKPFVGVLTGHSDSISAFAKCRTNITQVASGSYDGEIRYWDISERRTIFNLNAHNGIVRGLTFCEDGLNFLSCGSDNRINYYRFHDCLEGYTNPEFTPTNIFTSKTVLTSIDHHFSERRFATSGQVLQIWSYERSLPIQTYDWGIDSILKVKFNPAEPNLVGCVGLDRSITLYDIRGQTPIRKNALTNKSMTLAWNPMEPINFTVGNDDSNCYTFDMRKLDIIKMIHKDHIGAVMDIDYSPTGKEFATGSYDKTVRIFPVDSGKSREVYHGQRMQKVFSVCYTLDGRYILSGSEDMNVRIWKSKASDPIGQVNLEGLIQELTFLNR